MRKRGIKGKTGFESEAGKASWVCVTNEGQEETTERDPDGLGLQAAPRKAEVGRGERGGAVGGRGCY